MLIRPSDVAECGDIVRDPFLSLRRGANGSSLPQSFILSCGLTSAGSTKGGRDLPVPRASRVFDSGVAAFDQCASLVPQVMKENVAQLLTRLTTQSVEDRFMLAHGLAPAVAITR
jgi:hypothetical protein